MIRGSIQQEDIKILNLCATNNKFSNYRKVKVERPKETEKFKISENERLKK